MALQLHQTKLLSSHFYGYSSPGLIRHKNEDHWKIEPDLNLYLLADGIGGYSGGEVASKECLETLASYLQQNIQKATDVQAACCLLTEAIQEANHRIYQLSLSNDMLNMGTTLCCFWVINSTAILAHVGDSRIYIKRQKKVELLTIDHSLYVDKLKPKDLTKINKSQIYGSHILTNIIGRPGKVIPTINTMKIKLDDLFLICSDGLTDIVSHSILKHILLQSKPLEETTEELISAAFKAGGKDNITTLLIHFPTDDRLL